MSLDSPVLCENPAAQRLTHKTLAQRDIAGSHSPANGAVWAVQLKYRALAKVLRLGPFLISYFSLILYCQTFNASLCGTLH